MRNPAKPQWRVDLENEEDRREQEHRRRVGAAKAARLNEVFAILEAPYKAEGATYEDAEGYRWELETDFEGASWLIITRGEAVINVKRNGVPLEGFDGHRREPGFIRTSVIHWLRQLDEEMSDE